jgi:4-diphosphocytidyl-2-C-methyl-D-erythritol kinase
MTDAGGGGGPVEVLADGGLRALAPAKINLNLLVGLVRADGFHPLDSYVTRVNLADELTFHKRDDGRIVLELADETIDTGPRERNLVVRAARLLRQRTGRADGASIRLVKRIPAGGGLGGGSSDAAATLQALRRLWNVEMAEGEMAELAAELGSDVPLFLRPGPVRMRGRGEILEPVEIPRLNVLLMAPDMSCPTGEVYGAFEALEVEPVEQLDPSIFREPVETWRGRLVNQLAPAARAIRPELATLWDRLSAACPAPVCLTGSGSTLFALFGDGARRDAAMARLEGLGGVALIATESL